MLEIEILTLRNFMSYGNNVTTVDLRRPGAILIVGENLDDTTNGIGANGVGKSTLINALAYVLYDKPISKISKDNLVNNINGKHMEVTVTFTLGDGNKYYIRRARKMKVGAAGNTVSLFINGEDRSQGANTNAAILKLIGIPYEMFVRGVVFSATHTPFLDLPTSHPTSPNQKSFIEELFSLTVLTEKAELLKKQIKDNEASLAIKKSRVDALESEFQRHLKLVDSAQKRVDNWVIQHDTAISRLQQQIQDAVNFDFVAEIERHSAFDKLEQQFFDTADRMEQLKASKKTAYDLYIKSTDELAHLRDEKCPFCLQHFEGSGNLISDLEIKTDAQFDVVEAASEELVLLKKRTLDLKQQIIDAQAQLTYRDANEAKMAQSESKNAEAKMAELVAQVNPFTEALTEMEQLVFNEVDYSPVNTLIREIEHQKFLLKLLTKSDSFVRKELMNKNIPYLNQRLREYISEFGLPHSVEFTHEMTAKISRFGRELEFGNLSAGQAARVNFALSLAFRDVRERQSTRRVNLCMLDEVLDHGLDSIGVELAVKLIKRKASIDNVSMYVITHRTEVNNMFANHLTVQMQNGFSTIKPLEVE